MITIKKTVYEKNLCSPDSYLVKCGAMTRTFPAAEKTSIGEWLRQIWENSFFPETAYVYCNINRDADGILYCKYEPEWKEMAE